MDRSRVSGSGGEQVQLSDLFVSSMKERNDAIDRAGFIQPRLWVSFYCSFHHMRTVAPWPIPMEDLGTRTDFFTKRVHSIVHFLLLISPLVGSRSNKPAV